MVGISFRTFVDLRFLVPPLINLFLYYFLLFQSEGSLLSWVDHYLNSPHSILIIVAIMLFLTLAICFMIFTSITIPFDLTLRNRVSLQFGNFSLPWTASFIASFILPPTVFFYVVFPVTVLISPFYEFILNLLRHFFGRLLHTLQRFPGVDVIFVRNGQNHGEHGTQPTEQPPQFESPDIEMNSAQDQPNSEPNSEPELAITVEGIEPSSTCTASNGHIDTTFGT